MGLLLSLKYPVNTVLRLSHVISVNTLKNYKTSNYDTCTVQLNLDVADFT